MRVIIITTAAVVAASLVAPGSSFAQFGSQASKYNQCAELASRQGLRTKSANGRRFMTRCMQGETYGQGTYRSSPNCPDDPRARSAYPAWMCR